MQRLPPRDYVQGRAFELASGQSLALEPFRQRLDRGRLRERQPGGEPGRVRGARLAPRCVPDGQRRRRCASICSTRRSRRSAASIRTRSARSMRSTSVRLLPAREVPLDPDAVRDFRRRFRTRFEGDPTRSAIYRGVSEGLAPAGSRVLPAAVLRDDRDAVRLPAGGCGDRARRGAARRRWRAPGRTSRRATRIAATTSSGRCSRPGELFLDPQQLAAGLAPFASDHRSRPSRPTPSCRVPPHVHNFPTTRAARAAHRRARRAAVRAAR